MSTPLSEVISYLSFDGVVNAGTTYETIKVILQEYGSLCIKVNTDETISFTLSFSDDGTNFDYNSKTIISSGSTPVISSVILGKWCKISINNSSTSNANIRFTTYCQTITAVLQPQLTSDTSRFPSVNVDNFNTTLLNDLRISQRRSIFDHKFDYGSTVNSIYISPDRNLRQKSGGGINLGLNQTTPLVVNNTLCMSNIHKSPAGAFLEVFGQPVVYFSGTPLYCMISCGFKLNYVDGDTLGYDQMLVGMGFTDSSGNVIDGVFLGYPSAPQPPDTIVNELSLVYYGDGVEFYVPRSRWSFDQLNGLGPSGITLDISKLSTWRLRASQVASIYLEYHKPFDNEWVPCHRIQLENKFVTPGYRSPSLGYMQYVKRTSTATGEEGQNQTGVYATQGEIGVEESEQSSIARLQSYGVESAEITIPSNTETAIFSVRAGELLNLRNNRSLIFPKTLSTSCNGNRQCVIKIYREGDFTAPVWTYRDSTYDPLQTLTGGTATVGTGYPVVSYFNAGTSTQLRELDPYDLFLSNGQTITITAKSSQTNDVQVSFTYALIE